jgi:hypothetical protein
VNLPSRSRLALWLYALVGLAVAILALTAQSYMPFFSDDSLISLRYSDRLLGGHGLTYNDGEYVEGYSNLLWVLAVAAGGLVHPDLVAVARVLGFVFMAAALAAPAFAARSVSWTLSLGVLAGVLTLALSHGAAIWSIGGLEQPLQLALLGWALALLHQDQGRNLPVLWVGGLLALLVLTRPDGAVFTAALALALVIARGPSVRAFMSAATLVVLPLAAWVGQLAFRLWYYDDWVPNTAHVKVSWSIHHLMDGIRYVGVGLGYHLPVVVLAIVVLVTVRPFRRLTILAPLAIAILWACYVAAIGGDGFPGRRHVLPLIVCAAMILTAGWTASVLRRLPVVAQVLVIAVTLLWYSQLQARDPLNVVAREEVWEWECATLAGALGTAFEAEAPLIAADPVGCVGYFGKLPTLDMLGLTDRHIARTRPEDFGQGWIGHELGDGQYVLSRDPDLILFCTPRGSAAPCYRSGIELAALPQFNDRYTLTRITPRDELSSMLLWLRVASPKVGIWRSPTETRLPAMLFASEKGPRAVFDGRRFATRLGPGQSVTFGRLPDDVVGWRARAVARGPVGVSIDGRSLTVTAGDSRADLLEVVLTPAGEGAREVRLKADTTTSGAPAGPH